MLRLGVTGGIGSGKTFVCSIFSRLGIPVYSADSRAKELVYAPTVKQQIIDKFGAEAFMDGKYNRAYIASIVFNDKVKLEELNKIIHPAVLNDWQEFCLANAQHAYIVKEAAIMLEIPESRATVDQVVLVTAPEELRIKRVIKRDGISEAEVIQRMKNQLSDEEKIKLCDWQIINDESHSVIEQVYNIHQTLIS